VTVGVPTVKTSGALGNQEPCIFSLVAHLTNSTRHIFKYHVRVDPSRLGPERPGLKTQSCLAQRLATSPITLHVKHWISPAPYVVSSIFASSTWRHGLNSRSIGLTVTCQRSR
jgi:hypothetical protein